MEESRGVGIRFISVRIPLNQGVEPVRHRIVRPGGIKSAGEVRKAVKADAFFVGVKDPPAHDAACRQQEIKDGFRYRHVFQNNNLERNAMGYLSDFASRKPETKIVMPYPENEKKNSRRGYDGNF